MKLLYPEKKKVPWIPILVSVTIVTLVTVSFGYKAVGKKRVSHVMHRVGYLTNPVQIGSNKLVSLQRFPDKYFRGIRNGPYTEFYLEYLGEDLSEGVRYEFRITCDDLPEGVPYNTAQKCYLVTVEEIKPQPKS